MRPDDPPNNWWRIDPSSGASIGDNDDNGAVYYLGDAPLDAAGTVATNIDATFGSSRHFTDEEARRLLLDRIVPNTVRPYDEAATELLESVDDLWAWVNDCYQAKWGRSANVVERRFIADYAFSVLRQK